MHSIHNEIRLEISLEVCALCFGRRRPSEPVTAPRTQGNAAAFLAGGTRWPTPHKQTRTARLGAADASPAAVGGGGHHPTCNRRSIPFVISTSGWVVELLVGGRAQARALSPCQSAPALIAGCISQCISRATALRGKVRGAQRPTAGAEALLFEL